MKELYLKLYSTDIYLKKLNEAKTEIYNLCPPPYAFPSDTGRLWQLLNDSITSAQIIKSNILKEIENTKFETNSK